MFMTGCLNCGNRVADRYWEQNSWPSAKTVRCFDESEIVELRSNVRIERIFLLDNLLNKVRFEALSVDEKRYFLDRHHCYVSVPSGVKLALRQADIVIYSANTAL